MLYVHNSSRVQGESHADLSSEIGVASFPSVRLLDDHGRVAAELDYLDLMESGRGLADHVDHLVAAIAKHADLLAQRRELDRELLIAELAIGKVGLADARRMVAAHETDASHEQRDKMMALLVDLEVRDLTSRNRELGGEALRARLAAMAKAERLPSDRLARRFWHHVLRHAVESADSDLYQKGVGDLRRRFAETPGYGKTLEHYESQLEQLRRRQADKEQGRLRR